MSIKATVFTLEEEIKLDFVDDADTFGQVMRLLAKENKIPKHNFTDAQGLTTQVPASAPIMRIEVELV